MKSLLTIIISLVATGIVSAQESVSDRLARLEQSNAAFFATQARIQADVSSLTTKVDSIEAKLDAFIKVQAPNVKFTPPTVGNGWNGTEATFHNTGPNIAKPSVLVAAPAVVTYRPIMYNYQPMSSYGGGMSSYGGMIYGGMSSGGYGGMSAGRTVSRSVSFGGFRGGVRAGGC